MPETRAAGNLGCAQCVPSRLGNFWESATVPGIVVKGSEDGGRSRWVHNGTNGFTVGLGRREGGRGVGLSAFDGFRQSGIPPTVEGPVCYKTPALHTVPSADHPLHRTKLAHKSGRAEGSNMFAELRAAIAEKSKNKDLRPGKPGAMVSQSGCRKKGWIPSVDGHIRTLGFANLMSTSRRQTYRSWATNPTRARRFRPWDAEGAHARSPNMQVTFLIPVSHWVGIGSC